jgi:hypothetical protein
MHLVEKAIEQLATIRKRPGMYFETSVESAENFLTGFRTALTIAGVPLSRESHQMSFERRGWAWTALRSIPSMRERGLSDDHIVGELIDALIDELRQNSNAP